MKCELRAAGGSANGWVADGRLAMVIIEPPLYKRIVAGEGMEGKK